MGHDILAKFVDATEAAEEVAYLRRGAGNPLARTIYQALNAEDCDCGCSGCGYNREFTQEELKAALSKLPNNEEVRPEREFLQACITTGQPIIISFW